MKIASKMLLIVIIAAMFLSLLPALHTNTQAAATPILVLKSTTAVCPILDHLLDYDTFRSGGPFTLTFEWKAVGIKDNDPDDLGQACATVSVVGTSYGSASDSSFDPNRQDPITGTTNWLPVSMNFENVGVHNVSGTNYPGNILRFSMYKAKGELLIRNIVIKNASGTVLYNLNTDPIVSQAVSNAVDRGLSEFPMSDLADLDYENCPWIAGQFLTGDYSASIRIQPDPLTTTITTTKHVFVDPPFGTTTKTTTVPITVTTTRVTTVPTTKPSTAPTTTRSTTAPSTAAPTTVPTTASTMPPHNACLHNYIGGICMNCFELDPDYRHPCLNGHDFNETGACKNCSIYDPHFFARCTDGHDLDENGQCRNCRYFEEILRPEPAPNDAHPNHDEDSNSTWLIVLIVVISLLLVGITVVVILLLKKKK